ncbi:putative RING-H2 finger protein ATL12 [Acorus gramineus]|uniref:RING-type E3 ubiquitin transferase n=1 Tax=Acorus gramineus TaxID=55184 RepID=A0AAV9BCR9_ACOGR|nr:putative RING-H2 finger protein ATL12 [Acorus gramineus]
MGILTFLFFIAFILQGVDAQSSPMPNLPDLSTTTDSPSGPFRSSIAIVIAVFSMMFSLTFFLLMYIKCCHNSHLHNHNHNHSPFDMYDPLFIHSSRFSGVDKSVIESLPFFRFSSLKGSRDGLECAVCLSRFDETETLRLLPKCKHAFHIDCIDKWLESHSSCPLCRDKVEVEDVLVFKYSNSSRFLRDPSERFEEANVELFIEREPDINDGPSSLLSTSMRLIGSFRKTTKKEEMLMPEGTEETRFLHKVKHRVIVSDVVLKNRWSDVNSSDLMYLNSEMLGVTTSQRFSSHTTTTTSISIGSSSDERKDMVAKIKEDMEKKKSLERKASFMNNSGTGVGKSSIDSEANLGNRSSNQRSMSEITNLSRFAEFMGRGRSRDYNGVSKEEKVRKVWVPIARRTVQWFAGRERRSSQPPPPRPASNV